MSWTAAVFIKATVRSSAPFAVAVLRCVARRMFPQIVEEIVEVAEIIPFRVRLTAYSGAVRATGG